MDTLSTSLDEIALCGLEGCTLRQLWQLLTSRQPSISFKLDDYTQSFIWNQLCECANESDLIQFYWLPKPREYAPAATSVWNSGSYDIMEYSHPYPYRPQPSCRRSQYEDWRSLRTRPVNSLGVKGSCSTFQKRKNVTREVVQEHMSLEQVMEKHGDSLAIVASQQLREKALWPGDKDPFIEITDVQYCLLEVVGCSRQYGIQRTAITSRFLKIDARSTFHHVKTLVSAGLISMKVCPMLRLRSSTRGPHLLFLPRYTPPEWISAVSNPAEEKICSIIAESPHLTLPVSIIKDKIENQMSKREFQQTRTSLVKKGYIERVTLEVAPAEGDDSDDGSTKVVAYRLLRPYESESKPEVGGEEVGGDEEAEEEGEEEIDLLAKTSVVVELPVDMQGYRLIDSRGPEGITNTEFCERGLAVGLRVCRQLAKCLVRTSAVTNITLDGAPVRINKLVSTRHLGSCKEYWSMNEEKAKCGLSDLEIAVQSGGSAAQGLRGKERKRVRHRRRRQQQVPDSLSSGDRSRSSTGIASSSTKSEASATDGLLAKAPLPPLPRWQSQEADGKVPLAPTTTTLNTRGAAALSGSVPEALPDRGPTPVVALTESDRLSLEVNESCLNIGDTVVVASRSRSSTGGTPVHRSPVPELESTPIASSGRDPAPVSVTESSTVRKWEQPQVIPCTYNQLKRLNLIMKYVKDVRVMRDRVALRKYMQETEAREGRDKTIDRKTVSKLLSTLVMENKLIQSSLEFKLQEQPLQVLVYHLPDVTESELTKAEEEARAYYLNLALRKELRTAPKTPRTKKAKIKQRDSSDEEEAEEGRAEGDDGCQPSHAVTLSSSTSRYQRLRHFHYYLWILAHGNRPVVEEEEGGAPNEGQPEEDASPPSSLPLMTFPWVKTVHKLPVTSKGAGWLNFNDICRYMPLSLHTILIKLCRGVLNSKYICYFEDPQLKDKPIHELPRRLRKFLTQKRRDFHQLSRLVEQLVQEMGLLTLDGSLQASSTLYIYLNKTATILDTSKAFPRRSFFLEESRGLFTTLHYSLRSLPDLERYWFELQSICLQTPIILVERKHSKLKLASKRRRAKQDDRDQMEESDEQEEALYANDTFPLPYVRLPVSRANSQAVREFNAQGFGAAGLPPLCFSHLNRNWAQVASGNGLLTGVEVLVKGERQSGDGGAYGPGVGLGEIPWTEMRMEFEENSEEEETAKSGSVRSRSTRVPEEMQGTYADGTVHPSMHKRPSEPGATGADDGNEGIPPVAKKVRLAAADRGEDKVKVMVVRVPGSQIKKNGGGKGKQRFRMKKALEAAKKVKKARESVVRYRIANKTASLFSDSKDIEGDERAREHKTRERVYWYPHEDSFLILTYLTSLVLNKKGRPAVSYSQIRDALHKEYQTSQDKSAVAIRRRLISILRKRQHLVDMVDICLAETMEEMDSMGRESPEWNFDTVLLYILRKYQVQKGCLLSRDCELPSTIHELRENYDIIGCQQEQEPFVPRPSTVEGDKEKYRAHASALIISSLGADKTTYDDYATFKLFESFPEADIRAAFENLKRRGVIRQKRSTLGIPRNKGPLESQSYELSSSFFSKLENPYPTSFFEEAAEFTRDMEAHRQLMADQISEQKPGPPPTHSRVTRLDQLSLEDEAVGSAAQCASAPVGVQSEALKGGSVAALVGLMFDEPSSLVSCEPMFPSPLLVPEENAADSTGTMSSQEPSSSSHQLLKRELEEEEEEEEGDQSEEGEEEMQEVGGGENEQSLPPLGGKMGWNEGLGLTSLLRIDENWLLQNGQLDLDLAISRGKILEPLSDHEENGRTVPSCTEEENSTSDGSAAASTAAAPSVLSLDAYLGICADRLKFSRADLNLAKSLYNVIECSGEKGLSLSVLCGTMIDSEYYSYTIDDQIQCLCNFQMVHRVGISHDRLVAHVHSSQWFIPSKDGNIIPYRPWFATTSKDPNPTQLRKYCNGVLAHIVAHPGVTLHQLVSHFSGMLERNSLREILQFLKVTNCIRSYSLWSSDACTAFSSTSSQCCCCDSSSYARTDHQIFYEAKLSLL